MPSVGASETTPCWERRLVGTDVVEARTDMWAVRAYGVSGWSRSLPCPFPVPVPFCLDLSRRWLLRALQELVELCRELLEEGRLRNRDVLARLAQLVCARRLRRDPGEVVGGTRGLERDLPIAGAHHEELE